MALVRLNEGWVTIEIEPYDVIQKYNFLNKNWTDYGTIKTLDDANYAVYLVRNTAMNELVRYRIIRKGEPILT